METEETFYEEVSEQFVEQINDLCMKLDDVLKEYNSPELKKLIGKSVVNQTSKTAEIFVRMKIQDSRP